ncbi:MAG: hypothetical protein NZ473_06015 [Candidatus Kapabacteria bacterium]|nr:hypothetical protein [Candidatus Kapabacteria bacterium]MDW8225178.1 hypothetical protein [Bacteroidota bacterium]
MRRGFTLLLPCTVGLVQPAIPEASKPQWLTSSSSLRPAIERAYARLLEGGSLVDSVQHSQLVERTYRLHERYGLPLGYELARVTAYGKSLLRLTYVGLYGRQAVVWQMHFHCSPRRDGWPYGWLSVTA